MTLCGNDFCDDDPDLSRELILASGLITPRIRRLAAHGYFALAFGLRRIEDLERNRVLICPELLQWSASETPRVEAAWERTLGKIRESRDFCQERGIVFALVYLGSDLEVKYAMDPVGTISDLKAMGGPHKEIAWDMSRSINRLTEYCEEWRIPLISLLEPLIDAQKETGKFVFGDHYTMFGHHVAAQVLSCAESSRMRLYASERPSLKNCVSAGSWSAVASSWDESSPVRPPFVDFVPASGPTPQPR